MASTTAHAGTESPPLEATGEQHTMGASSVSGAQKGEKQEVVSDTEQRKGTSAFACSATLRTNPCSLGYFKAGENAGSEEKATGTQGIRTMGESMQDKFDNAS